MNKIKQGDKFFIFLDVKIVSNEEFVTYKMSFVGHNIKSI